MSTLAITIHSNPDTFSSNATKPSQHVLTVYNVAGNARAMARIYAGLPNMSALVHCRLRHEPNDVAIYQYNEHHSSHRTQIGALQAWKD